MKVTKSVGKKKSQASYRAKRRPNSPLVKNGYLKGGKK